jgi:anti-sigma B factor antagonist
MPLARLDFERRGDTVVAHVEGDVDLSNSAELRRALEEAVGPDALGVAVDMSRVGYVDSTGMTVLATVAKGLALRRQRLAVVAPQGSGVRRLLELVGIDRVVGLHDSLDDAIASLAALPN